MDVSGEVADLMVKEGIQVTEASIKLLAAGSKNLAALLWALAKDSKKLVGKTGMVRLLREGKELRVFHIKESDLKEFKKYSQKSVLYAAIKDTRQTDGMVDFVTNVDFVSQVNLFMKHRGYGVPEQEEEAPKKAGPRAPQGHSSPQRGSGSTASRTKPERTTRTTDGEKPSVRTRLDACRIEAEARAAARAPQQRTRPMKQKTK